MGNATTNYLAVTLERVNGAWATLDLVLVLFMAYYLWFEYRLGAFNLKFWICGHTPLYIQAAIAIIVFHIGDFGVRIIVWYLRHQVNNGAQITYTNVNAPVVLFSFIAGFGILCKLRVFSSSWLGPWVWLIGALSGFLAAELTRLLPLF